MAMFKDNSPCKSPDHHKVISFDNLTKGKADIVFLNGWHDKFRSKKEKNKKTCQEEDKHYILKSCEKNNYVFGNYLGHFTFDGQEYIINSRFGKQLEAELFKMIDSSFFTSDDSIASTNGEIPMDYVIYASFISRLKLAKLSGFPSVYSKIPFRDYAMHGSLDVKNFIKKDQSFTGKISSCKSLRVPDEVVAKVLLTAYNIAVSKNQKFSLHDKDIKNFLLTKTNSKTISNNDINVALNSKSIKNDLYKDYKLALWLAKIIILKDKRYVNENCLRKLNFGYLLYAPNLFELYIEKILKDVILKNNLDSKFILKTQYSIPGTNLRSDFAILDKNSKKVLAILDAKYRHFYNGCLNKGDCKNLHQISKYTKKSDAKTGILIYAKNNVINDPKNLKMDYEKSIFILGVLKDNDLAKDVQNLKECLKEILLKIN